MPTGQSQKLLSIPPTQIRENPENPRIVFRQDEMESLLLSISRNGVQVPITVFREGSHYRLIDGERRWRCALKLNLPAIPALIQEKPTELQNLLLMYNIHALREQWDYLTIASKIRRVVELFEKENKHRPSEAELSEATGLTRGQIRRCQLLLDLPTRYHDLLLKELELPKSEQKLSEDLFIEMERALKTVVNRLPEFKPRLNQIRNVLIDKFRDNRIVAMTDFRQLSKIATSVKRLGISPSTATKALNRVFSSSRRDGIRDAYARTIEFAADEHRIEKQVSYLNDYLERIVREKEGDRLSPSLLHQLKVLAKHLKSLLKS